MEYYTYTPGPPLSSFVASIWQYEAGLQQPERALPTGMAELAIDLAGGGLGAPDPQHPDRMRLVPNALVRGPYRSSFLMNLRQPIGKVGVDFLPGGAAPFFALPQGELADTHVPLAAVWGAHAATLRERLLEATGPDARFRLLERALLAATTRPLERHPAIDYALRHVGVGSQCATIAQVVDNLGMRPAHFRELFRAEVGLSPKRYFRIRRFLGALRRTRKGRPINWAQLAAACGYYDQAHLINDFQEFTGVSPHQYLRNRHAQFVSFLTVQEDLKT
jgi:AraC-like DNA-binding protein